MRNGAHRFLADDDDTVRLNGSPLFTFSDGSMELMSEKTTHAFTWPVESPASLTAHAETGRAGRHSIQRPHLNPDGPRLDAVRKNLLFGARPVVLAAGSAALEAHCRVGWLWQRSRHAAGAKIKVVAAELEIPGAKWNLAFKFEPAQEVTFNGTELKFAIGSWTNDNWQVGFCRPGELEAWRQVGR
jgi:hypothetical protein